MDLVVVIDGNDTFSNQLAEELRKSRRVEECQIVASPNESLSPLFEKNTPSTLVYSPQLQGLAPNLAEAETVLQQCSRANLSRAVVISSAAIYGASPRNPEFIAESRLPPRNVENSVKSRWIEFEGLVTKCLCGNWKTTPGQNGGTPNVTILRPATVLSRNGMDYFSQLFRGRFAMTLPRRDPLIQLVSPRDLASAVCCAVERSGGGVYNVAPRGVIPLRVALRMAGSKRFPVPGPLQTISRNVSLDQLQYIRYSWTVSTEKIERELGFVPQHSSAQALLEFLDGNARFSCESMVFDDYGMDTDYIDACSRRFFRFLHDRYWRVEVKGLENVPRQGRAVLAGVHRGFMPFDGAMILHLMATRVNRYTRALIHPSLTKTPLPFNFEKLGGLSAYRENADTILQREQLLLFFPEGIEGAFRYYRDAYQLGDFGRDEYVKTALRNQAPIVPFVTVGSAEIFPILAKFKWRWWQKVSLWPCFPIAPPFPLIPIPLPSKWHTQFLEPLHVEYPPEASEDIAIVKKISRQLKGKMQDAIDDMLKHRKSIWYGSVFHGSATVDSIASST